VECGPWRELTTHIILFAPRFTLHALNVEGGAWRELTTHIILFAPRSTLVFVYSAEKFARKSSNSFFCENSTPWSFLILAW
jgi:hypothetical protein